MIHPVFLYHGKDIIAVPDNRDPLKNSAQFVGIIIYDTAHLCMQLPAVDQFPDQRLTCGAAADHHDTVLVILTHSLSVPKIRSQKPIGKPHRCRHTEADHIPHKIIASRHLQAHEHSA